MPELRLPDGTVRQYDEAVTGTTVATDIGPGLAKAALAIKVNGELKDLYFEMTEDCDFEIITARSEEALELLRHDYAHVMAQAVQELFPGTQVTIGPAIENGFYYDFARDESFSPEDLDTIQTKMREIIKRDIPIQREVWNRDEAIEYFKGIGEAYKAEIISDLPADEEVTVYRQGEWLDLCRGPHLPSTGKLPKDAFKLQKLAGAYWRGDSNNAMLQRIYGTGWTDKKALKAHLLMLEEAEKRDHRKLAKEMDLLHFEEHAPGAIFWHPKGWTLFQNLIAYMREMQENNGYVEICTPDVMDRSLWEKSGHWEKFGENMYTTQTPDERVYAIKPMNCPGGVQVFKQGNRSYRDLPLRIAEFGRVHRYEPSGALHGMMRVREFTQDDAHIYCTEDQLIDECLKITDLVLHIYKQFGFEDVRVKFSDRPEKRVGSDEIWDKSEAALKAACEAAGLETTLNPGEGAFYGPKLEFVLRDAIGRDWQCGTLQVDLNLPGRLGATYVGEDGDKHHPVMLHRALFGSLERFTGILLEHYAGRLPLWLSPQQVAVCTITNDFDDYAYDVVAKLRQAGIKAEVDVRNEKINYKIREHALAKVPVMFVIGAREQEEGKVTIRRLGQKAQANLAVDDAITMLLTEIAERRPLAVDAADD
jgi:threonyl-tRNA synthetase